MNKVDIVKKLLLAIEQCNMKEAASYLADDFTFSGAVPKPVSKNEWLDVHQKFDMAMPDFKFNAKDLNESGNVVNGTVQLSGTQNKELPSLMPGVPSVPATNKKIQMPTENFTVTFKGDKIVNLTVEKVPNGGVAGVLKQLGVTITLLM
jgi:hypothetical protein